MSQWYQEDSYEAQAHARVIQAEGPHKAHLSHELIAAAASYEAMKAYQQHCEKNGKPTSHAQAKEILAGLAGAFIDHIVETKGLDFIDREKAKHQAQEQLHSVSEREYVEYPDYEGSRYYASAQDRAGYAPVYLPTGPYESSGEFEGRGRHHHEHGGPLAHLAEARREAFEERENRGPFANFAEARREMFEEREIEHEHRGPFSRFEEARREGFEEREFEHERRHHDHGFRR